MVRTDGYYRSDFILSVDWHAGVRMDEAFVRFLRLLPDGYWLWKDVDSAEFDFAEYVRRLDALAIRTVADNANPPAGMDGDYEFQVGRYRVANDTLFLMSVNRISTANGTSLEIPWTGTVEIRSPLILWMGAANARFDFVQSP